MWCPIVVEPTWDPHGKKSHSRFLTQNGGLAKIFLAILDFAKIFFGDFALRGKYTRDKWICLRRQITYGRQMETNGDK